MSGKARREAIVQRSRARRLLLQSLYQWQINPQDGEGLQRQALESALAPVDVHYLREGLAAILPQVDALEAALQPFMKRRPQNLDPVERGILWLAAYELWLRVDIPAVVVINEAVELAKQFGAADSYKFINGVLDRAQRAPRPEALPALAFVQQEEEEDAS